VCISIHSNENARKTLEGKPALAIPMRIVMQLNPSSETGQAATNAPTERKHLIPLRALISYLAPSLQTYVCPSLMRRMRYSFSANPQTERK